MSEREAILFINEAFYSYFTAGDAEGMDILWAKFSPVTCIHPGAGLLSGRQVVVESWREIMRLGAPIIRCRDPKVCIYGNTATILCFEEINDRYLIATNIFIREVDEWKMVHHQAGPTHGKPSTAVKVEQSRTVN